MYPHVAFTKCQFELPVFTLWKCDTSAKILCKHRLSIPGWVKNTEEKPLHKQWATEICTVFLLDYTALKRQFLTSVKQLSFDTEVILHRCPTWALWKPWDCTLFLGAWKEKLVEYVQRIRNQSFTRSSVCYSCLSVVMMFIRTDICK